MGKLSRLVTLTAVAAAAGAGVYYYLNKDAEAAKVVDVENPEATQKESMTEFFKEKREAIMNSREYVSLSRNLGETKDALVKTVTEAAEMIKERAAEAKEGCGVVSEDVAEKAEDFQFDEFTEEVAETVDEVKEDVAEAIEEAVEESVEE